jgi:hypothetical protein
MTTTIEIEVEVDYTYYKGDPGNISGLPENCYPPEDPDAEITSVMFGSINITNELTEAHTETLVAECISDAQDRIADRDIP